MLNLIKAIPTKMKNNPTKHTGITEQSLVTMLL
jgi:hypothetical protein